MFTKKSIRKSTLWLKTVRRRDTPAEPTGMYSRRVFSQRVFLLSVLVVCSIASAIAVDKRQKAEMKKGFIVISISFLSSEDCRLSKSAQFRDVGPVIQEVFGTGIGSNCFIGTSR